MTIINWFIFEVIIPLLSVPFVIFGAWLLGVSKRFSEIVKDGQLCVYCSATIGVLLRDLSIAKSQPPVLVYGAILGFSLVLLMLSIFVYGVAVCNTTQLDVDRMGRTSFLTTISVVAFVATIRMLVEF